MFSEGAVGVTSDVQHRLQSPRNEPTVLRRTMQLAGEIRGSSQSVMRSEINRMARAFLVDGSDSGLLHDDGSPSVHYLTSAGSLTGVKVLRSPSFNKTDPAEYATYRSFNFTVQADYRIVDAASLYDFVESVAYHGNCGPRKVQVELDSGFPDEQIVSQRTVQTIVQTGRAVGLYDYPSTPSPLYPKLLQNPEESLTLQTPQSQGRDFTLWPVSWRYVMKSDRPLNGPPIKR